MYKNHIVDIKLSLRKSHQTGQCLAEKQRNKKKLKLTHIPSNRLPHRPPKEKKKRKRKGKRTNS